MAVYEGKWRCSSCGAVNRGASVRCVCGNARDQSEPIFVEDDAPAVTDAALVAAAEAGPNWFCGYCGAENVHGATECKPCGGSRAQSDDGRKVQVVESAGEPAPGMRLRDEPTPVAPPRSSRRAWVVGGAVVSVVVIFLVWLFGSTRVVEATVAEATWTRSVQVDQLGPREEGWEHPTGAEVLHTEQRQRLQNVSVPVTRVRKATKEVSTGQTRKVKTGRKIDLGNGFFRDEERDVPVTKTVTYDEEYQTTELRPASVPATWYVFRAWRSLRTEELTGENGPRWPAVTLLSEQRTSNNREQFAVVLAMTNGKSFRHTPKDEAEFQRFQKGALKRLKVNRAGWLLGIE